MKDVCKYGVKLRLSQHAEVVMDLYESALAPSSRRTYRSGKRAYDRFIMKLPANIRRLPFIPRQLSELELSLAFFVADMVLDVPPKAASTMRGYLAHVKYHFRAAGCDPELFESVFLKQLLSGMDKSFPTDKDKRIAFLLPEYITNPVLECNNQGANRMLRLATVLGFIGMLRPHTFNQIQLASCTIIMRNNEHLSFQQLQKRRDSNQLAKQAPVGFYIRFKSKTQQQAKAYFPYLGDTR